jgi:uncharacterized membrane protein
MLIMQTPKLARKTTATRVLVILAFLLVFIGWLLSTPTGLLGKADALGYAVCHRIPERSFQIEERALPLCARCSGMFLGAVMGLAFQAIVSKRHGGTPHWGIIVFFGLLVVAFGVDGSNSYLYLVKQIYPGMLEQIPNLYIPNNTLRLLTGTGMGLGMATALYPAFTQTVWREWKKEPALTPLKTLGLFAIALVLDLLILTESPVVLYPVAFLSAAGILLLLTMVYSIVWITLMGQDNLFDTIRQMWLPLLAGLTLALIQVFAIDMLRLWLTGTWGGFPLG